MAQYLSPGVYVEEVPSTIKPIAGVSTSTAGFIGVIADAIDQPLAKQTGANVGTGDGTKTVFNFPIYPIGRNSTTVKVDGTAVTSGITLANDDTNKVSTVSFGTAPAKSSEITADITPELYPVPAGMPKLCTTFSD